MPNALSLLAGLLVKTGIALLVLNEVRGFVLAVPILYGMYEAGGTLMTVWVGICSLAGIAVSVAVPLFVARKLKLAELRRQRSRTLQPCSASWQGGAG